MSLSDDRCSSLSTKVLIDARIESVHPRRTYCNLLWDVKLERHRRAALLALFERCQAVEADPSDHSRAALAKAARRLGTELGAAFRPATAAGPPDVRDTAQRDVKGVLTQHGYGRPGIPTASSGCGTARSTSSRSSTERWSAE